MVNKKAVKTDELINQAKALQTRLKLNDRKNMPRPVLLVTAENNLKTASSKAIEHIKIRLKNPEVKEEEIQQAQATLTAIKQWLDDPTNDKTLTAVANAAEEERKLSPNPKAKHDWGYVASTVVTLAVCLLLAAAVLATVAGMCFGAEVDLVSPTILLFPWVDGGTSIPQKEMKNTPQQEMKNAVQNIRDNRPKAEVQSEHMPKEDDVREASIPPPS
ncbi:MAG: hypothetical protein P1U36_04670 [Legionellaceae bacterium]|nr:hypothetical protein [Legionellaceae bacterium]